MRPTVVLVVALLMLGTTGGLTASASAEAEPLLEASESQALVQPLPADSDTYRNDDSGGVLGNLKSLFRVKIAPSMVGALLLLVLSLLFSTVNFYAELRRRQRNLRKAFRYLLVWSFVNYVFALLFLILILPDGLSLASINRTLVMYCLVATALPELSANIRLQLGRSDERTLDLYKYKTKVSDLIARRMERASARAQGQDRAFLEAHYASQPDEFLHRFRIFVQSAGLSEVEQAYLKDKLQDAALKSPSTVLEVVGERPALLRKVLDHFADDVERFRVSPKARLLTTIQPDPTDDEVQQLVQAGITTARGFLFRTMLQFQRRRLSALTGIADERLRWLRVSTADAARQARRRRLRVMFWGLTGATAVMLLLAWHGSRLFPQYEPAAVFAATDALRGSAEARQ